jgi:hypothetical protein
MSKLINEKRSITVAITICLGLLSGCGSDSNSTENTESTVLKGQFLDNAVAGLSYKTETQSGVTNLYGEYNYIEGETVTFSIGDLSFPPVTAAKETTPVSISPTNTMDDVAINIAWLLQSLDSDGDLANGISIPSSAATVSAAIDFDVSSTNFSSDAAVVNLVANSGSTNTSLIPLADATAHLSSTIVAVGYDRYESIESYSELIDKRQVQNTNSANYFYLRSNNTMDGFWAESIYEGTWYIDDDGYFCRTVIKGADYLMNGKYNSDCQLWRIQNQNTILATREKGASDIYWTIIIN